MLVRGGFRGPIFCTPGTERCQIEVSGSQLRPPFPKTIGRESMETTLDRPVALEIAGRHLLLQHLVQLRVERVRLEHEVDAGAHRLA